MRNTKQKDLVLEIVNNSYNHPTAYMVYEECIKVIPNISLTTVYRNLNTLVEDGKIRRIDISNLAARYDNILNHDHFQCIKCGNVYDVDSIKIKHDEVIDGHIVTSAKISYKGICSDCLKNKEKE